MIALLVAIPIFGAVAALLEGDRKGRWAGPVSLAALGTDLLLLAGMWSSRSGGQQVSWIADLRLGWIPQLGIGFHIALDGLSAILIFLTLFLGIMAVVISWDEIRDRRGLFHFNLLLTLAGIIGVFLAFDLVLFYLFWELMLIPMYFLISLWGHENRAYASVKFFIFTQLGGLLMLLSFLGLYFVHGSTTGTYTFDYIQLLNTPMTPVAARWIMAGFLLAFGVKLPSLPLHTWLPDAHAEAPTAGSIVLAGLLLKTGAYGLLRFAVPLLPDVALAWSPWLMAIGAAGILYGAVLAFGQTDIKRMIAYTSVSHMGFVLVGIFVWNDLALQGVVMQMVCHGLSTGGLFMMAGALQERTHTRSLQEMGGLKASMPRLSAVFLLLGLASLGLPGLGNFVAEILILFGTFQRNEGLAVVAALGFIFSSVYALWMIHRLFHGSRPEGVKGRDAGGREMAAASAIIALLFFLGIYPGPVLRTAQPSLSNLTQLVKEGRQPTTEVNHHASPKKGVDEDGKDREAER
jgi:NADH-quinone oxidoreductase subunit M